MPSSALLQTLLSEILNLWQDPGLKDARETAEPQMDARGTPGSPGGRRRNRGVSSRVRGQAPRGRHVVKGSVPAEKTASIRRSGGFFVLGG